MISHQKFLVFSNRNYYIFADNTRKNVDVFIGNECSTDGNPLIATPENCNLPINCNFFLQPNQAYYKSG